MSFASALEGFFGSFSSSGTGEIYSRISSITSSSGGSSFEETNVSEKIQKFIQDMGERFGEAMTQNGKTALIIVFLLFILTTALFVTLYIFDNRHMFSNLKAYALIAIIVSAMCILLSIIIIMYIRSDKISDGNGIYFSISAVLVLIQIIELIGNIKIYSTIH
jgi:hypothetical protein